MNKANWVLFFILNILLTSSISNYYVSSCNILNIAIWNSIGKLLLWLLLSLPVQFVIFPILYEFLNRKSPIFLFLNKLKKLNFSLTVFVSALGVDALAFLFFLQILSQQYLFINNRYLLWRFICKLFGTSCVVKTKKIHIVQKTLHNKINWKMVR